jgi:hypothetical protein
VEETCRGLDQRTRGEDDDQGLGSGVDAGRSLDRRSNERTMTRQPLGHEELSTKVG